MTTCHTCSTPMAVSAHGAVYRYLQCGAVRPRVINLWDTYIIAGKAADLRWSKLAKKERAALEAGARRRIAEGKK